MEVVNKKDGNKNFMIIKDIKVDENDYKLKMIKKNNIENIMPITIRAMDGEKQLYYNVTDYVSVRAMFSRKKMSGRDLYNMINDINKLSGSVKEYLLDLNDFLFDADYIYVNKRTGNYSFCYCPNTYEDVQQNMRKIFDQILEYIDHNNKPAVLIAYGIQQITINDSFTVQDLYKCARENYKENKYIKKTEEKVNGEYDKNNIVINADKNVYVKPFEAKKRNLFRKIVEKLKGKNNYEDEDELMEGLTDKEDIKEKIKKETEEINDYEESTMLLTSTGIINKITLKEISEQGSMEIEPKSYPCILGKSQQSSDYIVDSPVVSRVHLRISEEMSNYYVEDLNSTNGTYVNGKKLEPHKPEEINVGDQITIADVDFIVE